MQEKLVEEFRHAFESVRGVVHESSGYDSAIAAILGVIREENARCVALAALPEAILDGVAAGCRDAGIEVLQPPFPSDQLPGLLDRPDIGITGMAFGVAESGTLAEVCTNDDVRLVSSLPRLHIGVIHARDIVPRLTDAAAPMREALAPHDRNVTISFLSGPSRTGDIELILTLGVHGPEAAHAVIITGASS